LLMVKAFDHLFDQAVVGFDPEDGSFIFRTEPRGEIFIEGESDLRHWTVKALARAGFSVTNVKTIPYIQLPSGNKEWVLFAGGTSQSFRSLYDLVSRLKKII